MKIFCCQLNIAWEDKPANYAKGWAVNSAGNRWHLGDFAGSMGELVRTADGFCWAILDIIFGFHGKKLVIDMTPTRPGTIGAILLPSVAATIDGSVGRWVNERGDDINAWVSARTTEWFGQGAYIVVALAALGVSVVLLQQVLRHLKDEKAPASTGAMTGSRS